MWEIPITWGINIVTWLTNLFTKRSTTEGPGQSQKDSAHAQQASHAGGDIIQAGRDVVLSQENKPEIPWRNRPGGPMFRMNPGIDKGRLLCSFHITAEKIPGGVEARWVGAGTDMGWVEPMPENVSGKYQMKPVPMNPTSPTDEVKFEVQFYLEDGLHGGQWIWPLQQHEKGHWLIEP